MARMGIGSQHAELKLWQSGEPDAEPFISWLLGQGPWRAG